jgi:hypothetical protein
MDRAFRSFPLGTFLGVAVLATPGLVVAAPPAPTAPQAEAATVEELSVQPSAICLQPHNEPEASRPRIVSTFPAHGAVVRPGVLILRVTFDQPMSCKGFFASAPEVKNPCPDDRQYWVLSYDRRTIRTACHTEAGHHYGVRVSDNSLAVDSKTTFVSLSGKRPTPYVLIFDTSSEAQINTAGESLEQDLEMLPKPPEFMPLKVQDLHFKPK